MFCHQFKAMAGYKWTASEAAMHLLPVLQGQTADALHRIPPEVTHEYNTMGLKGHYMNSYYQVTMA
jgi:hypothetical protein